MQPGDQDSRESMVEVDGLKLRVVEFSEDRAWRLAANPNGPVAVPDSDAEAQGWEQ
jgi:hypothetical protein